MLVPDLSAQAARPVKLEVQRSKGSIQVGERTTVTVRLLDAENHIAQAPKNLPIEIDVRLPSNEVQTLVRTTLRAGQNSVTVPLPAITTEGFLYIWAKQPELLPGGAYLRVRGLRTPARVAQRVEAPTMTPRPSTASAQPVPPAVVAATRPESTRLTRIPIGPVAALPSGIIRPHVPAGGVPTPAPAAIPIPAPPPPTAAPGTRYNLALRYSPQRTFLANGKDAVTVHAFVLPKAEGAELPGFRVSLFDGSNTLIPRPLVIPPGAEEGTATLTYDHVGTIRVEYIAANPSVQIDGDRQLDIHFDPPITGIDVKGNAWISFVDSTDVVITTVGDAQQPIATDEARTVSLALTAGSGNLSQPQVTIASHTSDARAEFTPLWWGTAVIAASTPNLLTRTLTVEVGVPWMLLVLSIAGGLAGGWVFVLRYPRTKMWRIPAGALTGIVLLWSVLYLGRAGLPRAAVLNPFSIFVVSVIGGWLGTAVFQPLAKKFSS
ncbi:MAG: hypothetical protein ABI833_03060 [Acidobacteriota bacterium]